MLYKNILAALVGLNRLCYARPSATLNLAVRSEIDYSDIYVSDVSILDAFDAAGNGPLQAWKDDNNETYQSLYVMDEADWDSMHHHLLEKAYNQRLEEAFEQSPEEVHEQLRNEAHKRLLEALGSITDTLLPRVDTDDPKTWICNKNGPLAYRLPLSGAISVACGGFLYGAGAQGQKQVMRVSRLRNGESLRDRYGNRIVATVSWTWKVLTWAGSGICGAALNEGIKDLCDEVISGNQGSGEGSRGFHGEKYKKNGRLQAQGGVSTSEL